MFLIPPQGFNVPDGKVCRLVKALYGLKQASRKWYREFSTEVVKFGFEQSKFHHCLFTMMYEGHFVELVVYVDDILLIGLDQQK